MVARGEVAWLELEQEGRRPVVVLTRDDALPRLRNIVVALVTRTIRGIDTEVELGPEDGMPVTCAVSLDNLRTVPQALLTEIDHPARRRANRRHLPGARTSKRLLNKPLISRRSSHQVAPAVGAKSIVRRRDPGPPV